MNNKSSKLAIAAVACLLAILFLWHRSTHSSLPPAMSMAGTGIAPSIKSSNLKSGGLPGQTANLNSATKQTKEQAMSRLEQAFDNVPITFYGKVIDQNEDPVAGAEVNGAVGVSVGWMNTKVENHQTLTDGSGAFMFKGLRGADLSIFLSKQGYKYSSEDNGYKYAAPDNQRHHPDLDQPVIFRMWKMQGPQNLTRIRVSAFLPCDGTSSTYDLFSGLPKKDGQITLSFIRKPADIGEASQYDWSLLLAINGGGLIRESDQYPDVAPSSGYRSSANIEMSRSAEPWEPQETLTYYIETKDGRFGRMTVYITASINHPPSGGVSVTGFVNPTGSRNLETLASHK